MDNLTIARIVCAGIGAGFGSRYEAEDLVDWVHSLRVEEPTGFGWSHEAEHDTAYSIARACLDAGEEAEAEVRQVIDHEKLEIRAQALGAACNLAKGAVTPWTAKEIEATADVFEQYLLKGKVGD